MEKVREGMTKNLNQVQKAYEEHAPQFKNLIHLTSIDEKLSSLIKATQNKVQPIPKVKDTNQEVLKELAQLNQTMLLLVKQLNKPSWLKRLLKPFLKKRNSGSNSILEKNHNKSLIVKEIKSEIKPSKRKVKHKKNSAKKGAYKPMEETKITSTKKHFAVAPKEDCFSLELDETFVSRKHLFEIQEIGDDKALYRIVQDVKSREIGKRELFSHLENATEVIDRNKGEIGNLEDGELIKTPDGWRITKKAKIEL